MLRFWRKLFCYCSKTYAPNKLYTACISYISQQQITIWRDNLAKVPWFSVYFGEEGHDVRHKQPYRDCQQNYTEEFAHKIDCRRTYLAFHPIYAAYHEIDTKAVEN